jgi:hypothetical protein
MGPIGGSAPRRTGRQAVGTNITWTWTWVIALKKKVIVTQRNVTSGHSLRKGHATKTNWPTDRRSQYNLNLNLNLKAS